MSSTNPTRTPFYLSPYWYALIFALIVQHHWGLTTLFFMGMRNYCVGWPFPFHGYVLGPIPFSATNLALDILITFSILGLSARALSRLQLPRLRFRIRTMFVAMLGIGLWLLATERFLQIAYRNLYFGYTGDPYLLPVVVVYHCIWGMANVVTLVGIGLAVHSLLSLFIRDPRSPGDREPPAA